MKLNWTSVASRALGALITAGLLISVSAGCGDQGEQAKRDSEAATSKAQQDAPAEGTDAHRKRFGNLTTDGLSVEKLDLNSDGKPDQWTYKNAQRTVRVERDMNFDGKVDLWQYLNAKGDVVEEEMDLDLDGKVDVVAYYKDGVVTRKAMLVNFNDKFSIVKFYSKEGTLLRVERDQNGDGKPDLWEYYNDKGKRERVAWDQNGDGVPDEFDKLP